MKEASIELQHALLLAYLKGGDVYGAIPTGEVRWEWAESEMETEHYSYPVYHATVFAMQSEESTPTVRGRRVTSGIGIHVQEDTIKFYSSGWSHEVPRKDIPEFNHPNSILGKV